MNPLLTYRSLVIAVCIGLWAAGCGDSSTGERRDPRADATTTTVAVPVDAEYQRELRRIDRRLDATMGRLFSTATFTQEQVTEAKAQLSVAEKDLAQLEPPSNVAKAHQMYLDGVRGFPPILDRLAAAQGNQERIRQHLSDPEYTQVIDNLGGAKQAFQQQGYRL